MARKYIFMVLSLIFFAGTVFGMGGVSKQETSAHAEAAKATEGNQIIVYYFHGDFRCVNCYNMEKWTKEVVETEFKDDLASGRIGFHIVNTDTKGNEHFMADYGLYTKSVVLALVKSGKEVRYDNLTRVWDYLRNEGEFKRYVKGEIEKYLKEL